MSGCEKNRAQQTIDAFIEYFNEIKPYHTKILEVVEKLVIKDSFEVSFEETYSSEITQANDPACKEVGWGVDFDAECGYSAPDCCDLFDCIGGYGLIFDNSDLLVSATMDHVNPDTDTVRVYGDRTYDTIVNVKSINDSKTLTLDGNVSGLFTLHNLFLIVPSRTFEIVSYSDHGLTLKGNHEQELLMEGTFRIYGGGSNDGNYALISAKYHSATKTTSIGFSESVTLDTTAKLGFLNVKANSKNRGAYLVKEVKYNGLDTVVTVEGTTPLKSLGNSTEKLGGVLLRTGMLPGRQVFLENTGTPDDGSEVTIIESYYDEDDQRTIITVAEDIPSRLAYDTQPGETTVGTLDLRGYMFSAGFDGNAECTSKNINTLPASFSESLTITIVEDIPE